MNKMNEIKERASKLHAMPIVFRTENQAINHLIDRGYRYIDPIKFENSIINKKYYYSRSYNIFFIVDDFNN